MKKRLIVLALALGLFTMGSAGCIVRTGPGHRHQSVDHRGKHAHHHCHHRGHGKNRVCHTHPHKHPGHH